MCIVDHVTKKRVGEDVRHIHTHTHTKERAGRFPLIIYYIFKIKINLPIIINSSQIKYSKYEAKPST